ncbi:peroxisomal membrane protein PMP47B [Ascosphaera apis ARSEF 7405]|uniref:Peroxisomal membrane protein PMP47B n=1 Tax=Ascosphaera apis ARSEF 7405 TaxID=392613 RepID=A0A166NVA4_9EURO|nr:peroxisomal membrane protein PMP47B [Ascosphaera apis ARSEF 7405]
MSDVKTAAEQRAVVAAATTASQQSDNIAHALAGAGGGILSMILTYPLITLSTRAQVESKRARSSTIDAIRHIVAREGIDGLYSGLGSALAGISVTNFVYYYWYEWTRAAFEKAAVKAGRAKKLGTIESMIAGAIAGSATVIATNPIWVINTRMTTRKTDGQTLGEKKSKTTFQVLKELLQEGGIRALFAGVLPALILVINPILQYSIFEQLKNLVAKRRRVTPTDAFYLGAIGKLLATSITYPYITLKSRMHVASKEKNGEKQSMNQILREIVSKEGWSGLYKGSSSPSSLTSLPASFFMRNMTLALLDVHVFANLRKIGIGPKVSQSVLTAAFLFAFKDVLYDTMVATRRKSIRG